MPSRIEDGVYRTHVMSRHNVGNRWRTFYISSLLIALFLLIILLVTIANRSVGLVALTYEVAPSDLSDRPLEELSSAELAAILLEREGSRMLVMVRDNLSTVPSDQFTRVPISEALAGRQLPEGVGEQLATELTPEQFSQILALNMDTTALLEIIDEEILHATVEQSWDFTYSLFNRGAIETVMEDRYPEGELRWRVWLTPAFIGSGLASTPADAGIRPALLGTIYVLFITIIVAFPLGVGAAIYLEEYARDTMLNRVIEINIRNLAGVPSIIYGLLGLAIFVRLLEGVTQGRTILSAGLTMALLILPLIIINAQEAIRAVPFAIREASYGLGATQWQTISRQILPAAIPGIMTGTILAMSRAIGETAPLIVVGATTFITVDPNGIFSRFTALPILIYNWTSQPNEQYRNIASAGIIVLITMLLVLNATAIYIRNRTSRRRY